MTRTLNLLAAIVVLTMAACSGLSERQKRLLPAMRSAWPSIETDVRRGIDESAAAQRIEAPVAELQRNAVATLAEGLTSGSTATLASVSWAPLAESANFGLDKRVEKQEIHVNVAGSLRMRLQLFGESLTLFLSR